MPEAEVAKVGDLEDGTMRGVQVGDTKVLLARVDGQFHAVGARCPHYGAPLPEGALCGTRIICPWHHASFDVTTGDLLEPPAFDCLPSYPVRLDGERVFVSVPEKAPTKRIPSMSRRSPSDHRIAVILGGGAAGYMAAQTLREDGFGGRVVMITREERLPYDRPNLSKDYLQGNAPAEWMPLRSDQFFADHEIEVMRGKKVVRLDATNRSLTFADGSSLSFDLLLAATGGVPRTLSLPLTHASAGSGSPRESGAVSATQSKNVFLLRSFDDADAIMAFLTNAAAGADDAADTSPDPATGNRATSATGDGATSGTGDGAASGKGSVPGQAVTMTSADDASTREMRAAVIGASFIGMEVAGSLAKRKCAVTVIAPSQVPFERTLGPEIGALFQRLHESNGVRFRMGARVQSLEGDQGAVRAVVLQNGERLECDLVIVGVGVDPATDGFEGVDRAPDGGVIVDRHLRAADSVYAAGDIASFPTASGSHQRIEHWRTALQQGRIAAHNMAGKPVPYTSVPFFWTRQLGVGLMYVGNAQRWDEILYRGDLESRNFLAFYVSNDQIVAVAGMNRARDMAAIEGLMIENRMPTPAAVKANTIDFPELLRTRK